MHAANASTTRSPDRGQFPLVLGSAGSVPDRSNRDTAPPPLAAHPTRLFHSAEPSHPHAERHRDTKSDPETLHDSQLRNIFPTSARFCPMLPPLPPDPPSSRHTDLQ